VTDTANASAIKPPRRRFARAAGIAIAAAMLIAFAGGQAAAQGKAQKLRGVSDDWQFGLAAYAWLANLSGTANIKGTDVDVDQGFNDIVRQLDFVAAGMGEARKGKWSLIGDAMYLKISDSGTTAIRDGLTADLKFKFRQTLVAGYAGYRVWSDQDEPAAGVQGTDFDLLAGVRYNRLEPELTGTLTALGISQSGDAKDTVDWADPVIGARLQFYPGQRSRIVLWGDVGGFGVGSDMTWQLMATYGYTFDNGWDLFAAYRAYAYDYTSGSGANKTVMDLTTHGPVLGVGYKF